MKKECKLLLRKNNEREKEIFEENEDVYTNMIVYLRGADITQYNQELVREDIIELILDGQQRGDNIEQVMGSRYQEICDEIIAVMPKRTVKEKLIDCVDLSLSCVWILGVIYIVKQLISMITARADSFDFTLTIGNLISGIAIILVANVVVEYICKTAFKEKKKQNKLLEFLKNWVICFIIFAVIILSSIYLTAPLFVVPMVAAIIFVGVVFVAERVLAVV